MNLLIFNHHHGHLTPNQALGLLIASNLIMILIYLGTAIRWFYKPHLKGTFFKWMFDTDSIITINHVCFVVINALAFLIWIAYVIADYLDKIQ